MVAGSPNAVCGGTWCCCPLPKGHYREERGRLFPEVHTERTKAMVTRCNEGKSGSLKGKYLAMRLVKHWHRLPSEELGSPSLEKLITGVLRTWSSFGAGHGLGSFSLKLSCDSAILKKRTRKLKRRVKRNSCFCLTSDGNKELSSRLKHRSEMIQSDEPADACA